MEYQKECSKTGGDVNTAATPSELQFKIASLIGPIFTAGILNTEGCDTTEASSSSSNDAPLSVQPRDNSVENLGAGSVVMRLASQVSSCAHLLDTPAAKRSKMKFFLTDVSEFIFMRSNYRNVTSINTANYATKPSDLIKIMLGFKNIGTCWRHKDEHRSQLDHGI